MKLQTKFSVGDRVRTPISERPGVIEEIRIAKVWYENLSWKQEYSDPQAKYLVRVYFPHLAERQDTSMTAYFNEHELRAA